MQSSFYIKKFRLMKYYWSKFNYLLNSKRFGLLLYNSLSGIFWALDDEAKKKLDKLRLDIENEIYQSEENQIHNELEKARIISLESNDDLVNKLKLESRFKAFNYYNRKIIILPTTACNFACSYCYEEDRPEVFMNDEVVDAIFQKVLKETNPEIHYNITWYGGEPLLGFSRIESITQRLIDSNINFTASIVTNGYLINEKFLNNLQKLKIKFIQVTLDGDHLMHDRRRPLKNGKGTYEKIISNLDNLKKFNKKDEIYVNIRVNIDLKNKGRYFEFAGELSNRFPTFHIYPGIVTNYSECNSGCLTLDMQVEMIKQATSVCSDNFLPILPDMERNSSCMATEVFSYIIGPQGELYKCLNDIGKKEMVIGSLMDRSHLNTNILSRYLIGVDAYELEECKDCLHLPRCNGGCPNEQYLRKYKDLDISACKYFKDNLDTLLEMEYQRSMKLEIQ